RHYVRDARRRNRHIQPDRAKEHLGPRQPGGSPGRRHDRAWHLAARIECHACAGHAPGGFVAALREPVAALTRFSITRFVHETTEHTETTEKRNNRNSRPNI